MESRAPPFEPIRPPLPLTLPQHPTATHVPRRGRNKACRLRQESFGARSMERTHFLSAMPVYQRLTPFSARYGSSQTNEGRLGGREVHPHRRKLDHVGVSGSPPLRGVHAIASQFPSRSHKLRAPAIEHDM